jgi:hypothetical protein
MSREYPRFGPKVLMRRLWSLAPPNRLLDATLFTPPMLAFAQWVYFHKRSVLRGDPSGRETPATRAA